MYLEGGDQYRGWFHSSLLIAVGLRGEAPYRASATNGWTLDGEGHALSKSKGAEEVEKVINKYGAELLRLWTASVDFTEDVRFSDTIVSRLIEAYRKLRNTFRYALGNLHDFDPGDRRGARQRAAGDRPLDSVAGRRPDPRRTRAPTTRTRSTRCIARSTISRPPI